MFGVFRVKNHDFTPKDHIFPILGVVRAGCAPPGSAPAITGLIPLLLYYKSPMVSSAQ
jgi:hypothetical protein